MPVAAMLDPAILLPAIPEAIRKLDPRLMIKNPVMFVVEVVTVLTTVLLVRDVAAGTEGTGFSFQIVGWLWVTLLFANLAEAVAEGRGKAQAASLRRTRTEAKAKLVASAENRNWREVSALTLKPGDLVLVEAGDLIPSDGEIVDGVAFVDESAITGKSAPVIRESGGDRSAVTGGTRVLSDPDPGADHGHQVDLHRPHDCPSRGCGPAEDAERDRPEHPARRHDADLRPGRGQHPQLRRLCRRVDPGHRAGWRCSSR